MKATAKYLFDEDFAAREKPTITLVEAERRRADAESQAHRAGFAAGLAQAQREALAVIADGLERLHRALTGIEARLESEAVEVAVAVAGKLAPELIAREPFAEISALATETFSHLVKTPHVVVRIGRRGIRGDQGQARRDRTGARIRGPPGGAGRAGFGARRLPHRMGRRRRCPRPRRNARHHRRRGRPLRGRPRATELMGIPETDANE